MGLCTWFDPSPRGDELPTRMPSPFRQGAPHPLAQRAAQALLADLQNGPPLSEGKMFGVLVVAAADGRIGFLRGFSGMLEHRWSVEGFVPPLFDVVARDAFWPAGEAELDAITAALGTLESDPTVRAHAALLADQAEARAQLDALHRARRAERHAERARVGATAALAQASRADAAERRHLLAAQAEARRPIEDALAMLAQRRESLEADRRARSRDLLARIYAGYIVENARGERRPMTSLYAPAAPPGGAGDCAAPKLLSAAFSLGLKPIALAELWWGAPPAAGDRRAGAYYPACRRACGTLLPFMLEGLDVEPPPAYGAAPISSDEPRLVYEDEWLLIVDKPVGLLSVPGRGHKDSVQSRLRARLPDATGPLLVHRLDLDTSGLLVAAKDLRTHGAVQRLFTRREVGKRYVAWLDGHVEREAGVIDLPLRVDLDDRPRQIYDPELGRAAVTEFRVLERVGDRTKVALYPRTGRTHQLRVHAAHPRGLGAPIVGDPLYGEPGPRMLLHAEQLSFVHPHTQARIEVERPAPF